MTRSALVVLCLAVLCTAPALAGVPSQFVVQGKLSDAGGIPLPAGAKTFNFRIFDDSSAGAQVWPNGGVPEIQVITTAGDGQWLGLVGAISPLSADQFADEGRWLQISVDGTTLPRIRLLSDPYALRVATIDGAAGGTIDKHVVIAGGNLTLNPSSNSSGNVIKDGVPFIHDFGTDNTFIGSNAGNLTMSGSDNMGSGANAMFNNASGHHNTATGANSLLSNVDGHNNTASGNLALQSNVSGDYNTATGSGALSSNLANNNTATGFASLNSNTSGPNNTAAGANALRLNESGYDNTASGTSALENNTIGGSNTATGFRALRQNTTGIANTATGAYALRNSATADSNTASGHSALYSLTSGYNNTACGASALYSDTAGIENTATGFQALFQNVGYRDWSWVFFDYFWRGSYNTANGSGALRENISGSSNTAMGSSSLYNNTTGSSNSAVGTKSLNRNTAGSENTAVGYHSLFYNTAGSYNSAIGYNSLRFNSTGNNNSAFGNSSLSGNYGDSNTAVGAYALYSNELGTNNTAIGAGADVGNVDLRNATAIGAGAIVGSSNKIRLGNQDVSVIQGEVAYTFTSDSTKKEKFQPVDGDEVLRKIREMSFRSWNYIGNDPQQIRHYGPMAQEFFNAFGHDGIGTIGSPTTINSGDQAGILMIAIQALARKDEALERRAAEIDNLKSEIAELRELIQAKVK